MQKKKLPRDINSRAAMIGDLQIEQRLALGIIFRLNDLLRFILAGCVEAGALAGGGVLAIELSAPACSCESSGIVFS
jgi:hypothetical protein